MAWRPKNTTMIKDRDTRDALQTLETEFENLEAQIKEKDEEIEELQTEVSDLKGQVEEYEARITELEEALAESYLTSEVDDAVHGKDVELSPGCGSDVPDSTGDKAADS